MVNMKRYSSVLSLFREMRKLGIPINDFILNIVINNYCLMHCSDCGFSVLAIYLKKGIPFNVVAFSTLLRGLFAESKIKDAVNLFKKLVRENICEPDEVMYSIVMNGLSKMGHTQKTFDLLRVMEQGSTKPNTYIYNIVIDALCKDRMLDAAIGLFEEMKQKEGLLDEAKDMLRKMEHNGHSPDNATYNIIVRGFLKFGETSEMTTFLKEMTGRDFSFDASTIELLIDVMAKDPSLLNMIPQFHSGNKK
ncbi:PREDICTED: putative pentatricopeptide repeat-containing protein At1g12700, mitochondrial [Nicotiana attenuata]|uniref:putative pentatricopeptide repeat-containing protein At1g12700, mitochondrial n=1 Tax=Nicotiana attenuata TaxID=49451 RepID=UPI000904FF82|nr:PREDICTED: putative pentatricopeptide repeat-containing protein At1g12700, mitochondrial [Nicotiana attenuata]